MPIDPDFCPAMSCSVFDYIFKGASQPLIGNFAIPLGDYIEQTKDELERRVEILTAYFRAKQSEKAIGRDDTTQIKGITMRIRFKLNFIRGRNSR